MIPTTPETKGNDGPPVEAGSYTVPDIAVITKTSDRHIWRQIDLGVIPGVFRLGRLVRISKPIFDAWLAVGCPRQTEALRAADHLPQKSEVSHAD
jgi:excisionase family DNA binding protein